MLQSLMQTLGKVVFSKPTQEKWLHSMCLHRRELCPKDNSMCLLVWDDGEVHTKCRYAKITNTNPEMMQVTQTGKQIGMRCVPSQAIDFILGDG